MRSHRFIRASVGVIDDHDTVTDPYLPRGDPVAQKHCVCSPESAAVVDRDRNVVEVV